MTMRLRVTKTQKALIWLSGTLLAAALLGGCGASGSSYSTDNYLVTENYGTADSYYGSSNGIAYEASEAAFDYEEDTYDSGSSVQEPGVDTPGAGSATKVDQTKIVYTASLSIETLDYAESKARIRAMISEADGFIEFEQETDQNRSWYDEGGDSGTKSLSLTVRVPASAYDAFLNSLDGVGRIMNRSANAENISREYASAEAYLASLEIEQERLLEMMEAAEQISDMILIEERLTEVESALNQYRTRLESMDLDVSYSTVTIYLNEVRRYSPTPVEETTFAQRVRNAVIGAWEGFRAFLEGLLVVLIYLLPYLILIALVVLVIRAIRKAWKKKHPNVPGTLSRKEMKRIAKEQKRMAKMQAKGQVPAQSTPGKQPQRPTSLAASDSEPEAPREETAGCES